MPQYYSDPKREQSLTALPDIEVFWLCKNEIRNEENHAVYLEQGWYWWSCFPGCMPDGDPIGPFDTELDALRDARQ